MAPETNLPVICCWGEILLRLSPSVDDRWLEEAQLPVYLGGAELNVSQALRGWGLQPRYVSALPANAMSRSIRYHLEKKGIDIRFLLEGGERIGIYYLTQGRDLQHAAVAYDRRHSSFAGWQPGTIPWNDVLENARWFHFSAISPALGAPVLANCREALKAATQKDITVSVDLNYRARLWENGPDPKTVMPELVAYCDVLMGNIWSANSLLGIEVAPGLQAGSSVADYLAASAGSAEILFQRFPRLRILANTFRFEQGSGVQYFASLHTREAQFVSPVFETASVIDKVGSGDCFMAGLIRQLVTGKEPQETISFAAAAAFGKLQERGDATRQTVQQVEDTLKKYA